MEVTGQPHDLAALSQGGKNRVAIVRKAAWTLQKKISHLIINIIIIIIIIIITCTRLFL